MKKLYSILLILFFASFIHAEDGFYMGDGGKGINILVYDSTLTGKTSDETKFVPQMVKKSVISNLGTYSALTVIDSDQQETVKKLQQESESEFYDDSNPIELGKLKQAKLYITLATEIISQKYRISCQLIDVESGNTTSTFTSEKLYEKIEEYLMKAPKEASAHILDELGIKLTPSGKRNLLPDESKKEINQKILENQEDFEAISKELANLYEEKKKSLTNFSDEQRNKENKAKLELKEQQLQQQQQRITEKIKRLEEEAVRKQLEEEADQRRTQEQKNLIKKLGQEVEYKVAEIQKQQAKSMNALQKISIIESEKQLLASNWTDIETGSIESSNKLAKECEEEKNSRRNQKPHSKEVDKNGNLSEMAQQLLNTDLEMIQQRYDKLQKINTENEKKLKTLQDPLKKKIKSDIQNLISNKYVANTLADEGLYLQMGEYDVNKLGWNYTLTYAMNDQQIFTKEGFFAYKDMTGKEIPEIPGANDKKYKEKKEKYQDFLDTVETIDSFFRLSVPYLQAKVTYSVMDLSSVSPSVYGISVSQVEVINIQRNKTFRKENITEENLYTNFPVTTLKPVDETVSDALSKSNKEKVIQWSKKDNLSEVLKKNSQLADYEKNSASIDKTSLEKSFVKVTGNKNIDGFRISPVEVPQQLYEIVMDINPSETKGNLNPVENVSWFNAVVFCNKYSRLKKLKPCYSVNGETDTSNWTVKSPEDIKCDFTANGFRLLTEKEWEYAAKEGSQKGKFEYSGSNSIDEVAWYANNSSGTHHQIGTKKPNSIGLYDMSGNIAEWCWEQKIKGGSGVVKETTYYDSWSGRNRRSKTETYSSQSDSEISRSHSATWSQAQCYIGFRIGSSLSATELTAEKNTIRKQFEAEISENLKMVKITGGVFNYLESNVKINDFSISSTEINQKLYELIMEDNPSYHHGEKFPVENVTWEDAVVFCNKLSKIQGLTPCYFVNGYSDTEKWDYENNRIEIKLDEKANGYRLPKESEWEFAAKGGKNNDPFVYSGSDNLNEIAWTSNNARQTQETGTKKPNILGLYDMSGNVAEWCWDSYDDYYTNKKIVKGGSCIYDTWYNTFSDKEDYKIETTNSASKTSAMKYVGFRVVSN